MPAPAQTTNIVTIGLTLFFQNTSTDNGTVVVTRTPVQKRVTTKDILAKLAYDKFESGDYPSPSFPAGAQLTLVTFGLYRNVGMFQVIDKQSKFLVDVSDIIKFTTGTNLISSGKNYSQTTLGAPTLTGLMLAAVSFDDTHMGSGSYQIQFSTQGMLSGTVTDGKADYLGSYVETQSAKLAASAGEGSYAGMPFVMTGTMSIKGKARF
jgi:hypothetical protein